jgi:hypothetical protein
MDVMAVSAALAARGHGVAVLVPAADLGFAQRAAARHGGGGGADRIEWLPAALPFHLMSGAGRGLGVRVGGGGRGARVGSGGWG